MRLRLLSMFVASATMCGCAAAAGTPTGNAASHAPAGLTSHGPTASGNRTATAAEAKRLLALAPLPPGATPTSLRPKALSGPAVGTPASTSLVDRAHYYLVNESYPQVYAFAKAHRPAGLKLAGTGSSSTRGVVSEEGIGWSEPDRKYAVELEATVGVTPTDHGTETVLRADGLGEWLDPRPVRDTTSGSRLHVNVASGCPSRGRDVRNQDVGLKQRLLPKAKPTAALICEYDGSNRKPHFGLGRSARLDATRARKLQARFERLKIPHVDGAVYNCPAGDGTANLIAFAYHGRQDVDLYAEVNGCASVRNGDIVVRGDVSYRPWAKPLKSL
jgi:hypothetical protein